PAMTVMFLAGIQAELARDMSTKARGYADTIEASLTLVSERCADLTPLVYARLFREHPEMETLFWRDTDGAIKGEMLQRVFEVILDFIGEQLYGAQLIQCEVITHEGYDVPPDVFRTFFGTVAATIREQLGEDWTTDVDKAWRALLADLDFYVMHP